MYRCRHNSKTRFFFQFLTNSATPVIRYLSRFSTCPPALLLPPSWSFLLRVPQQFTFGIRYSHSSVIYNVFFIVWHIIFVLFFDNSFSVTAVQQYSRESPSSHITLSGNNIFRYHHEVAVCCSAVAHTPAIVPWHVMCLLCTVWILCTVYCICTFSSSFQRKWRKRMHYIWCVGRTSNTITCLLLHLFWVQVLLLLRYVGGKETSNIIIIIIRRKRRKRIPAIGVCVCVCTTVHAGSSETYSTPPYRHPFIIGPFIVSSVGIIDVWVHCCATHRFMRKKLTLLQGMCV